MKTTYLSDSGAKSRYNKAKALKDEEVTKAIESAERHTFSKKSRENEYKQYVPLKNKILLDTSNNFEKAILFADNGAVIFERNGTIDKISFKNEDLMKMKGKKLIHNHPSGQSLSKQDVALAISYELKEIIAIGRNGYYYRLKIKNKLDIRAIMREYEEATKVARYVLSNVLKNKVMTNKQVRAEYAHLIMSILADLEKGISYEKSKY